MQSSLRTRRQPANFLLLLYLGAVQNLTLYGLPSIQLSYMILVSAAPSLPLAIPRTSLLSSQSSDSPQLAQFHPPSYPTDTLKQHILCNAAKQLNHHHQPFD